jgi:hypothetical protein
MQTLVRSTKVCFYVCCRIAVSVSETVNNHDSFVMRVISACGFDDEMWLGWHADTMCAGGQGVFGDVWPMPARLWLLFDDSAFAFVFHTLASAGGCDFACLHELANI